MTFIALTPQTLRGDHVVLEQMMPSHLDDLSDVGLDPELWRWTTTVIRDRADMTAYVEDACAGRDAGTAIPFVIRHIASGQAVGSTRYGNISEQDRRLEIGWTWVAAPWQRSAVNSEAKLLLLTHAFETLHCNRVEFKTDALNSRSRNALRRLGATEEGVFRRHMVTASGRIRDTVYFSIIAEEWPAVRGFLRAPT